MQRLGLAITGLKHPHADEYARHLTEMPEARLVATWDPEPHLTRGFAERHQTTSPRDYDDLLTRKDVEAILVASPLKARASHAETALKAGKHVLCEVPLTQDLEEADRLMSAAQSAEARFQPCLPARHTPAAAMARQAIDRGEIGDVTAITLLMRPAPPKKARSQEGNLQDEEEAANGLSTLGDLARWYGKSEAETIYSPAPTRAKNSEARRLSLTALLRLRSGVIASLTLRPSPPEGAAEGETLKAQVLGTEGLINLDAQSQAITVHREDRPQATAERHPWGTSARREMIKSFLTSIRQNTEPEPNAHDGRQATEITITAQRSATERRPTQIPDPNQKRKQRR